MTTLEAVILGAVQGLTEFLPISSSGHLALGHSLMGFEEPDVFFDVVLHVGTLAAVLAYYRRDISDILKKAFSFGEDWNGLFSSKSYLGNQGRFYLLLLFFGTIPTGLIGFFGKEHFERAFGSVELVGVFLFLTAGLLLTTYYTRRTAVRGLSFFNAFVIGIAQGMAIMPGVSRSGATIAVAMGMKVEPASAARFSFLLSIPAILGALALKIGDIDPSDLDAVALSAGFLTSCIVGYAALCFLIRVIAGGRLHWFAAWCALVGVVALMQ